MMTRMSRDRLRRFSERCASVLVLPLVLCYRCRLVGFHSAGTFLSLIPGHPGMFLRRGWYRHTLERCGDELTVSFLSVLHRPDAWIGNHCFIGPLCRVGLVDIGDDVGIGDGTYVLSGMSQYGFIRRDVPIRKQIGVHTRVSIGDDCWIGAGVVIGSHVAAHSVVSSGAVVTQCFDEWQILSGVPAEPVATRPDLHALRAARQSRSKVG
jgi:acetyltransferase-like isoleucine patch superfamily enzyme